MSSDEEEFWGDLGRTLASNDLSSHGRVLLIRGAGRILEGIASELLNSPNARAANSDALVRLHHLVLILEKIAVAESKAPSGARP